MEYLIDKTSGGVGDVPSGNGGGPPGGPPDKGGYSNSSSSSPVLILSKFPKKIGRISVVSWTCSK